VSGAVKGNSEEGNFTSLALCESKDSLRYRRHQRSILLARLYMEIQKTAHIKLNKSDGGRSERKRERDIPRGNYAKKCAPLE
jgi:hypothetical protein